MQLNLTYKVKSIKYVNNEYEVIFVDLINNTEHTEDVPVVFLIRPNPKRITNFINGYIKDRLRQLTLYRY